MQRRNLIGMGLVILAAVVLAGVPMLCSAPEQPAILKIGVVNINAVFDASSKYKDSQEQIKKLNDDGNRDIKKFEEDIKILQDKLNLEPDENSETANQLKAKIEVFQLQRKQTFDTWRDKINKQGGTQLVEIYNDIRTVIDKYAKDKGYTLVLKIDELRIDPKKEPLNFIPQSIGYRAVLYSDKFFNITDDIIKILNEERK